MRGLATFAVVACRLAFLEGVRSDHVHVGARVALDVTSHALVVGTRIMAAAEGRNGQSKSEKYDALVNGRHCCLG